MLFFNREFSDKQKLRLLIVIHKDLNKDNDNILRI